eukprot:2175185-Pleurochrysis_carterae.AAC.7
MRACVRFGASCEPFRSSLLTQFSEFSHGDATHLHKQYFIARALDVLVNARPACFAGGGRDIQAWAHRPAQPGQHVLHQRGGAAALALPSVPRLLPRLRQGGGAATARLGPHPQTGAAHVRALEKNGGRAWRCVVGTKRTPRFSCTS